MQQDLEDETGEGGRGKLTEGLQSTLTLSNSVDDRHLYKWWKIVVKWSDLPSRRNILWSRSGRQIEREDRLETGPGRS